MATVTRLDFGLIVPGGRGPSIQYTRTEFSIVVPGGRGPQSGAGTRSSPVGFYKPTWLMQGRDVDAVSLTYRYWVVNGDADFAGIQYGGPKSGVSPLASISATKIR